MSQLRATLTLETLRCHAESEPSGHSEPYLWTTFFWTDVNTVGLNISHIATLTPSPSGRGLFPNDVKAGDVLPIPAVIGRKSLVLDDGNIGFMLFGCLVVLLEQNETSEDAIHFGHLAYGEAVSEALNEHLSPRLVELSRLPADDREAALTEIEKEIQKDVSAAVESAVAKSSSSFIEFLFTTHDQLVDFASISFDASRLNDLSSQAELFSLRFQKTFPGQFQEHEQDYEIVGRLRVDPFQAPRPEACQLQLDAFDAAVKALKGVDDELKALMSELSTATGADRAVIIADIKHVKENVRPLAVAGVSQAKVAYDQCKGSLLVAPSFSELSPIVPA
jgi:hypothetical protein